MLRRLLPLSLFGLVALVGAVAWPRFTADRAEPRAAPPTEAVAAVSPGPTPRQVEPPTSTTIDPCAAGPGLPADRVAAVPADLSARIGPAIDALLASGAGAGASIWVEGIGEVAGAGSDQPLLPASNQKVITAVGVEALLPADHRLTTEVVAAGPVVDGTLAGDLVLVAGGDPTLTRAGPHSLAELARRVRAAGVSVVTGRLVVDAGRHGPATRAPGWEDWQVGTYVGPISALTVDDNRHRSDPGFLADPAAANGELFAGALAAAGVTLAGPVASGHAPDDTPALTRVDSAAFGDLSRDMLLSSDNETAEALVREIGVSHGDGSTEAGTAAIEGWLHDRCLATTGRSADGSGLSRANARSVFELRRILQLAAAQPWGGALRDDLPVAGRSGTLTGRLGGAATAGRVQAKTGTILEGAALSGYATTAAGREVTFSIIGNGPDPGAITAAIDAIVVATVGWAG